MKPHLPIHLGLAACCGNFSTLGAEPLRDLSTDRPDTTESTYSVDKGHFHYGLSV